MQKGTLPLAEKREPYFVDCCRADRPGMADIDLLDRAHPSRSPNPGKFAPARLESGERFRQIVLRKVVVAGEMLVSCQLVIIFDGELIAALVPQRHTLKRSVRAIGFRHELVQQVERRLIHALLRNHVARKDISSMAPLRSASWPPVPRKPSRAAI